MKQTFFAVLLTAGLYACHEAKTPVQRLTEDLMTSHCKDFIVLTTPQNPGTYIFIDRRKIFNRFIIMKDFDYQGSGYGYLYGTKPSIADGVKNGIFKTLDEAIDAAKTSSTPGEMPYFLGNVFPKENGQWATPDGRYEQVCPNEPGYQKNVD